MSISRRKFIVAAPLAAGAILQFRGNALGQKIDVGPARKPIAPKADPLARLTWDSFYPYVTTNFTFTDSDGNAVNLKLARMDDNKPVGFTATAKGQECFSMTFIGSARAPLSQDVYTVEHFALGTFTLLITVLGRTGSGITYEAVINRLYS